MVPGVWPSLSSPLWIKRMASVESVVFGWLFRPSLGQQKPAVRAGEVGLGWWFCCSGSLGQFPQRRVGFAGLQFQLVDGEGERFKADVLHS